MPDEASFAHISDIASENKHGIDEMTKSVDSISSAIGLLSNLATENAANTSALDKEMGKFKT